MTIFEITLFGITVAPSYYGLMYAIGLISGYYIIKKRKVINSQILDDLLLYVVLGVVLGGRLAYVLFYNPIYFLENPLEIIKVWEGGMAFHGWGIGVILAVYYFVKKHKLSFLKVMDEIVTVIPIGIALGRFGNYLNKELLGFSGYYGPLSVDGRFPSPLVEMFLEGIVLFIILNIVYKLNHSSIEAKNNKAKNKKTFIKGFDGQIGALFLIYYSIFRIFVEVFFREPDAHIGYIFGFLTMGEILSFPMLLIGIYYYFKLKNAK